ncbi:hypothetical protein [Aliidiomarina sanyensis]|uniref:Uncharacterized protein n=1 Tax=Aliidiomarina sanyensis TaxID=1249555 RepID=A0A432WC66_9GAMM|nr:hypothetical protein [Aliidiomarina sanyensis]RUO29510.1 hypothetical protein CWE11_09690 [Aliidiomarina sanyensis]
MNSNDSKQTPEVESPKSGYSISKGGNVYFDVQGHPIRVWFSGWSGGERVYVNETEVSRTRSWRFMTTHHFEIEGQPHRIELGVDGWKDLFGGKYFARLYAGDDLIDQDWVLIMGKDKKAFSWKSFIVFLLAGAVTGFLVGGFVATWLG